MIWATGKRTIYLEFVGVVMLPSAGGILLFPSICGFSPPLGRLLLSKLDPLALLAVGGAFSVIIAKILIDIE